MCERPAAILYDSSPLPPTPAFFVDTQRHHCADQVAAQTARNGRVAEGMGFEPTIRHYPYNGLANRRLQPLGHPSTDEWVHGVCERQASVLSWGGQPRQIGMPGERRGFGPDLDRNPQAQDLTPFIARSIRRRWWRGVGLRLPHTLRRCDSGG